MFKNKKAFGALVIVFALTILVSSCGTNMSRKETVDPQTVDLRTLSAGDISAYRWNAMANYYAGQTQKADLRTLSAGDISAYRWNAMANYYANQAQNVDLRTLSAGDISAYRWNAMAEFYSSPSERLRALAAE